ncbi:class 2 aldolase adducin domain-containing protein [Biscogniauxia marginata]|nr:class 2 aldolase adducin domain-containing protein [Biscogniauxia marginata]
MAPSAIITETTPTPSASVKAAPPKPSANSALNCSFDKEGNAPSSLHYIPTFEDKYEERTLRDPVNPEHFWINPYAKHFATIKAGDLVLIDHEGTPVQGTTAKINTAGFVIHSAVHRARPDINAVCHMHSPYGRAWSTFGRGIEMLNQDSCAFYKNLGVYEGFGGVALAPEEGRRIADALGPENLNLILQNHGLLTTGRNVGEAAAYFIALERACEAQILTESVAANGIPKRLVDDESARYSYEYSRSHAVMYMQFVPEFDLTVELSNGQVLL